MLIFNLFWRFLLFEKKKYLACAMFFFFFSFCFFIHKTFPSKPKNTPQIGDWLFFYLLFFLSSTFCTFFPSTLYSCKNKQQSSKTHNFYYLSYHQLFLCNGSAFFKLDFKSRTCENIFLWLFKLMKRKYKNCLYEIQFCFTPIFFFIVLVSPFIHHF